MVSYLLPALHLTHSVTSKGQKPPQHSSRPVEGGGAVHVVRRPRELELTLPLTSCSSVQSGPYTSREPHCRAGPGAIGLGMLALVV